MRGQATLGARSRALAQDEGTQGRWREGECIATAQVGVDSRLYLPECHVNVTNRNLRLLRVRNYGYVRRRGAGIARNATALVSVRCTVHVRYTEAPYVYSVRTLHDVIGEQPIGWDHASPSPGVDPAAGDRFIHRTPKSL